MQIEKKISPFYFDLIHDNRKTFELRINDFECTEGDIITFKEYSPVLGYTGRKCVKRVGFVLRGSYQDMIKFFGEENVKQHGLQIISLHQEVER